MSGWRDALAGPLARRLVALAVVQALAVVALALVIAWYTLPSLGGPADGPHHGEGPPAHQGPPPRGPGPEGNGPRPGDHGPDDEHPVNGAALTLALIPVVLLTGAVASAAWLVPPLVRLRRSADRVAAGDLSVRNGLRRNDEIGQVGDAFDAMVDRVQETLQAERTLVATVSHELRTPLARVRVALELVEEELPEGERDLLEGVSDDLREVETLLDDIFAASRLDALGGDGVFRAQLATAPAADVARQAVGRARARAPGRPFDVIDDTGDAAPLTAHLVLVRRALENLLENAHRYTPPNAPIVVTVEGGTQGIRFSVQDGGDGMPSAVRERLFEPFVRGRHGPGREGLGLGLVLVKRIVDAHGGTIAVESRSGHGTRVSLSFPAGHVPQG